MAVQYDHRFSSSEQVEGTGLSKQSRQEPSDAYCQAAEIKPKACSNLTLWVWKREQSSLKDSHSPPYASTCCSLNGDANCTSECANASLL